MEDNKTPLNLSLKRNEPPSPSTTTTTTLQKHSSSTQLTLQSTIIQQSPQLPTTSYNQLVDIQYTSTQKVKVEKCNPDFFFKNFKQSYPMYKNPRGLCLIINIYQIHQMPPRRWSERDTDALRQLFEELMFSVKLYTDSTHDLTANNLKKIIKEFSQSKEHEQAQCCVICLMSHGEEGFLTSKDGDKILLDELFSMFNNVNCPYLAGKPKLFFIQSCRDDPISGPAEDLGIRISTSQSNMQTNVAKSGDEADGHQTNDNISHVPSLSDLLIGFPTQKGYIAYRKPEIGSWYMNAIVQIFSKHAKNTDLCAMLNMVNSMISKEVTNNGKKQMSEYTSKFTKPYLYFYPGLCLDTDNLGAISSTTVELPFDSHYLTIATTTSRNKRQRVECDNKNQSKLDENNVANLKHKIGNNKSAAFVRYSVSSPSLLLTNNQNNNLTHNCIDISKSDNEKFTLNHKEILTHKHKMLIANKGRQYWKAIAREMDLSEAQINEIDYTNETNELTQRLYDVINCWINDNGHTKATLSRLLQILTICKLNSIRDEIISDIQQTPNHSIIDEIQ